MRERCSIVAKGQQNYWIYWNISLGEQKQQQQNHYLFICLINFAIYTSGIKFVYLSFANIGADCLSAPA